MKLIRVKDSKEGGQCALEIFEKVVARGGKTFGLATGSTPVTLYEALRASDIDFRDCVSVNLDEYVGLGQDHEQSYAYFMQEHLFNAKPFKQSYLPNGLTTDLDAEVQRYNALLEEHSVDLQLLGIGRNGHIGFNEPGTSFDAVTHVVDLTPSTIEANKRFFADESEVPRQALSMGIKNIMAAKTIILMAFGSEKADAIEQLFNGPVTTDLPASILQNHPDVYVIVDESAATKLV